MTFLPTDYKIPETSNYMKLEQGANRFRIMSSAIVGYIYWNTDDKPVRLTTAPTEMPADTKPDKGGEKKMPKPFWAFTVYNYEAKRIQVLELTQKSIMKGIKSKLDNEAWGDVKTYDLVITREGMGLDTEYDVDPNPKTEITPEMQKMRDETPVDLEKLYSGQDPFSKED